MSDTPKTDAVATDGWSGDAAAVPVEFAREQERRISDLEHMLHRCEMWLSTIPEGRKMQEAIRGVLAPKTQGS